jgi:ubiquinone/menaquinone biosynthesis C-methylase UbiE
MAENTVYFEQQKQFWERDSLKKRRSPYHPVIKEYTVSKIAKIQNYIPIDRSTKVLDVGCGNGFFTFYLDQIADAYGIDFSERMIELNPVSHKAVMNAENMQFEDNSFDVVFCHALLHHVDDIDKVVQEMKRVSRKWIVLLEPNRNNPLMFLFSLLVKEEWKAMRFSLRYMKRFVKRNGLTIEKSFAYGMIVPNKAPAFALPFLRLFNFRQPFGMTNFIIARKTNEE